MAITYMHCYVESRYLVRSAYSRAQGTQPEGLKGERTPKKSGYMYTYSWFTLAVQQKPTQHCKATIFQ